jgi:glycosyltransferase involved in cell wall biosynthesis
VRVLLIAFYFPPAGGGGVQRPLKFTRYLPELGVDVDVLAPDDPKWFARDDRLLGEIPTSVRVVRARYPGPRAAFRGEALRVGGLRRLEVEARFLWTRLLVPDKAVSWFPFAVAAGVRAVRAFDPDVVMTTSPPNSVHLTGAAVARLTGRPWVADFRDPWLGFLQRRAEGRAIRAKRAVERPLARMVVRRADAIVAVTPHIADELAELDPAAAARTTVIENGADPTDFAPFPYVPGERFVLVHTGSFFGGRTPRPVLSAVAALLRRRPELRRRVVVRFVGTLRAADREWARGLGIDDAWEETGNVPFHEAVAAQRAADALLLLIEHAGGRGAKVPSGKLWEYVAARRPILATVPPDGVAGAIVRELEAGEVVDPDDAVGISAALELLVDRWRTGGLPDIPHGEAVMDRISRRARAVELAGVLARVAAAGR